MSGVTRLDYLLRSMEWIDCPICARSDSHVLYNGEAFRGVGPDGRPPVLRYVICKHCTHIYLCPRPSLEGYKAFYRQDDYSRMTMEGAGKSYDDKIKDYDADVPFQRKIEEGKRLYREYVSSILKEGDIVFDFGAGNGGWLQGLRELSGCRVDGNEASDFCVDFIKRRMGVDIFAGAIEEIGDKIIEKYRGRVRLSIVSGSLQHMVDPMRCLAVAHEISRDDGYLYICNRSLFDHYMSLQSKMRLFRELVTVDHPHYFHKDAYCFMVENAGWRVLRYSPHSSVRRGHMELFAQKAVCPQPVTPRVTHEEVLARIEEMERNIRRYRSFPTRLIRFTKRKLGLTASP